MTREEVKKLIETYGRAWETKDPDLAVSIFTEDATYDDPHEPVNNGIEAIRQYWIKKVIGEQDQIEFNLRSFWIDGDTVIAEWDATFVDVKRNMRIDMIEVAIFEIRDSKFSSLREYYKSKKIALDVVKIKNGKDTELLSLAYLTQSTKYLDLSEKIFEQMVKQGNKHIVISVGSEKEPHNIWENYREQTRWSDFNVIFPALFLFYHGVELMVKGFFPLLSSEIPYGHKSDLFTKLKKLRGAESGIIEIVDKYLDIEKLAQTPLGDWLQENKLNVDDLYERLRYPTDKNHSKLTNDFPLKYKSNEMIPFVEQIIKDSKELRSLSVSQFSKIYPNHT